jgi:nucleotidyltransferase/DNA polymerase involved in DNA repair
LYHYVEVERHRRDPELRNVAAVAVQQHQDVIAADAAARAAGVRKHMSPRWGCTSCMYKLHLQG